MNKIFIFVDGFPEKPNRELRRELKKLLDVYVLKELVHIDREMSALIKNEMQEDYWEMYNYYQAEFTRLSNIYNHHYPTHYFMINDKYFVSEYGIGGNATMPSPYKGNFSIIKTIQKFLNRWN